MHRDLHGLAQVSRKLGEVYLERDHLGRAAEALEQAAEYLSERDSAERAHIQLAMGRLAMARGDYEEATSHLRKAIDYCERYDLTDESVTVRRLLVKCYKMLGKAELALEHMRLLGESQAGMWQSLIEELDPLVRDSARRSWEAGAYGDALQAAFKSLEDAIRSLAHAPSTDQTSAVIRRYITSEQRGIGQFPNAGALQRYMEYVVAAFDLIRNPLAHTNRDVNAVDAAVGLCIVSFAAKLLVPKDEDEVA